MAYNEKEICIQRGQVWTPTTTEHNGFPDDNQICTKPDGIYDGWEYTVDVMFCTNDKNSDQITDKKSKEYFKQYLREHKVTEIHDTPDYSHIDLVAVVPGKGLYAFEIKKRNCTSYTYPDAVIDGKKYDTIEDDYHMWRDRTCLAMKIFYVNFYEDGKMYIWGLWDDSTTEKGFRPRHTEIKNADKTYTSTDYHHYKYSDALVNLNDERIKEIYN